MKWTKHKPEPHDRANTERIEELAAQIKLLADEIMAAAVQAKQRKETVHGRG